MDILWGQNFLQGPGPSGPPLSTVSALRNCLLDTSAFSALEFLWRILRYINRLTYLLT